MRTKLAEAGPSKGKKKRAAEPESDKLESLAETIDSLFNTVFVVRYRDVWHDVRAMCIKALGSWLVEYDSVMMDTKYVKYLGWALYDPKPCAEGKLQLTHPRTAMSLDLRGCPRPPEVGKGF